MSERWSTLRAFCAAWYREPLAEPEDLTAELAAAEAELDAKLPSALREWFQLAGPRVMSFQDAFPELEALELSGGCLRLLTEVEEQWFFGVELGAAGADPPVLLNGEQQVFERASAFLTFAVQWQTVLFVAIACTEGVDDDESHATLGLLGVEVRGFELDAPERYPSQALQLVGELPESGGTLRLLRDEASETLVLESLRNGELLGTMIATRTSDAYQRALAQVG